MMTESKPIFRLTKFSPVGFKMINYPSKNCLLCRGTLNDVCDTCKERKSEKCNVVSEDDNYYHEHCYSMINEKSK